MFGNREIGQKTHRQAILGIFALAFMMIAAILLSPFHAADTKNVKNSWLRAKFVYEFDNGITGLNDNILVFSNTLWEKGDDGWYYYRDPVKDGDKIRIIDGVKVPSEWTEEISNKKFRIIVTVEVSEGVKGDAGYRQNLKTLYSESFELWSSGYKGNADMKAVQKDRTKVEVHEYQADEDGNEKDYENDKTIIPGQEVSKIVEFEISKQLFRLPIQTGDGQFDTMIGMALISAAALLMIFFLVRKKKKEA